MGSKTTDKIAIGGLKFSTEQVQATLSGIAPDYNDLVRFLGELAEEKINLPFLCVHSLHGGCATVCMSRKDFDQQASAGNAAQPSGICAHLQPSTGSLTLFPHQSRLKILGTLLDIFGKNGFPLYSLCSSISALVINTAYSQLEQAARALQSSFILPDNHAPFRQQTRDDRTVDETVGGDRQSVLETAAAYWEPVIKIYGSSIKKDLLITTAHVRKNRLSQLGTWLQAVDGGSGVFEMALMQCIDENTCKFGLLYENSRMEAYRELFSPVVDLFSVVEHRKAELLYLHGPHFHDRYGVASAALSSLQKGECELFAVGCSGTSIYLITPEKKVQRSAEALEKIFIVPKLS